MKIIKVAIIEDIKEIAEEVRYILNGEEDIECLQVYHDAESAISFLSRFPADIVLCDIGLPRASGIEALTAITRVHPDINFCMFTVFEDDELIYRSLKCGAKGYILKNSEAKTIIRSIRELSRGGSPMSPQIARRILDAFADSGISLQKVDLPLTAREEELLDFLSQGLMYEEIAGKMSITSGTVKQHIHKIYKKLQVRNRTEAVNLYLNR